MSPSNNKNGLKCRDSYGGGDDGSSGSGGCEGGVGEDGGEDGVV